MTQILYLVQECIRLNGERSGHVSELNQYLSEIEARFKQYLLIKEEVRELSERVIRACADMIHKRVEVRELENQRDLRELEGLTEEEKHDIRGVIDQMRNEYNALRKIAVARMEELVALNKRSMECFTLTRDLQQSSNSAMRTVAESN